MTDDMMSLRALLEKSSDADLLREMVGFAAQRLMKLEVESLTGAAHGARDPERINQRNGYRDSQLGDTGRDGRAADPEAAQGQLLPRLPGAAADGREGALDGDPGGLCAGRVDALGRRSRTGNGHERDLEEPKPAPAEAGVSRLCAELDEKVQTFLNRPLEGDWPYV